VATVESCLKLKAQTLVYTTPDAKVVTALEMMRDKRVRAVLVMEDGKLKGIVTQGDCAIKVLLPGLDATKTLIKDIMTVNPMTVKLVDPLEACMGLMAARNFRHLPVVDDGKVLGVISIGDVVKDNIRNMGHQIEFLETYIKGHGNNYS
jgi:CBS domain-containing protein